MKLNPETRKILWRVHKESKKHHVRNRAHCILLLDSGYEIKRLIPILNVSHKTIYNWKNNWLKQKLTGLYNKEGRVRKKIFNSEQQEQIKEWAKQHRTNLKPVIEKIKKEWGIKTSKDTVKRVLKSLGMKWKRLRKIVGGLAKKEEYKSKKKY